MGGMKIGSLFSGIGGLDLAVEAVTGGEVAWMCERDPYCRRVLERRFPDVPIFEDVETITDPPRVDVIAGGFPCQDISQAGQRKGIKDGKKSGLWREFARLLRLLRPRLLFLENVSAITLPGRGLDIVLGDLASIGLDAEWSCFRASSVGAPHLRDRFFLFGWMADGDGDGFEMFGGIESLKCDTHRRGEKLADTFGDRSQESSDDLSGRAEHSTSPDGRGDLGQQDRADLMAHRWPPRRDDLDGWRKWIGDGLCSPVIRRGPDGFPGGMDVRPRLRALGNAVCPQQAIGAYLQLMERSCRKV